MEHEESCTCAWEKKGDECHIVGTRIVITGPVEKEEQTVFFDKSLSFSIPECGYSNDLDIDETLNRFEKKCQQEIKKLQLKKQCI